MGIKILKATLLGAGLALAMSTSAFAASEKPELMGGASAEMLSNTCAGCHGTNGASNGPATPTIAGLSKEYFIEAMIGFKSGEIPSTIMSRIAKGYSDDQIKLMSAYFARKPFVKAKQPFDEALVREGGKLHDKYCEKCHANAGQLPEDESGILAGQWSPYLAATMADYIAGTREMTKKMRKKVKKLLDKEGEAGLKTILNFYASQQ